MRKLSAEEKNCSLKMLSLTTGSQSLLSLLLKSYSKKLSKIQNYCAGVFSPTTLNNKYEVTTDPPHTPTILTLDEFTCFEHNMNF